MFFSEMSHESFVGETSSSRGNVASHCAGDSRPSLRSWIVPKLMAKLTKRGIPFQASARKAELFRLLSSDPAGQNQEVVFTDTIQTSLTQLYGIIDVELVGQVLHLLSHHPTSFQPTYGRT